MPQPAAVTSAQAPVSITQSGGQVQPLDAEGTMNGFTAVNGRTSSPPQPHKQSLAEPVREEPSLPPREALPHPASEGERLPHFHQPNNVNGDHMTNPHTNGNHKRKRSVGDVGGELTSNGSNRSSGSPTTASPDVHVQEPSPYNHGQRPVTEHSEGQWSGQTNDDQAEQLRMLAPIQHENQQHPNGNYASMPPVQNGHGMRPGYHKDESTGLITTNAGVQMDPKKRKRAFTNRTKTGCQTCRRRKKKCDEAKPECVNCTRGGFKCEGYTPRVSWPPEHKAKGPKQPLPQAQSHQHATRELQEFTGNLHPRPPPRTEAPPHMEIPPTYPNMRPRTLTLEDEQGRPVGNGWPYSPFPGSYRDKDPMHNHTMQPMRDSHDRPMSSMSSSNMHSMHSAHPMAHPVPPGVIGQAQQALHLTSQRGTPMPSPMGFSQERAPTQTNERQKMLAGELYEHSDSNLDMDRHACADLLHVFNTTSHQGHGPARKALRDVIERRPPGMPGQNQFRVGTGSCVDAPFRCEYGYNIVIGDYVHIEAGCHISDPRSVVIGKGSFIGPGVKIIGKVHPYRPELRGDAMKLGMVRGFEIHIGEGVYIGANSVIQPEEKHCDEGGRLVIGHRAYIRPGSVVHKSVPEEMIFGQKYQCDVREVLPRMLPEDENFLQNR